MKHTLDARREHLHGHFSPDLKPVLEIDPGDTVRFQCLDAGWGLEPNNGFDHLRRQLEPRDPILDGGHALTGPVFVRGANAGDVLAVRIEQIQIGEWGSTFAGGWPCVWNDRLGVSNDGVFHVWEFDREAQTATNQLGHTVKTKPFMGIYGLPPATSGVHSTVPPRRTGGNLDCKELGPGSTLYLPIEVDGALFSTGDGHAVQGDGEICITAIECPMEVELTLDLLGTSPSDQVVAQIKGLRGPIAHTPTGWVALGLHEDLDEAVVGALESMLDLMEVAHGLDRMDALALASLVVDFRVTQVVNNVKGVHAVLNHGAIASR